MSEVTKRDPFAPLGYLGNRGIQYGKDGVIPGRYLETMEKAIRLAYQLAFNTAFEKAFSNTVSTLANQPIGKDTYLDALDKMIIHYAETSKNPKAVQILKEEAAACKLDKTYQSPAAFSIVNGRDIWLREFLLKKNDPKEIAGAIVHEAAHIAGVPGGPGEEFVLANLAEISGYTQR